MSLPLVRGGFGSDGWRMARRHMALMLAVFAFAAGAAPKTEKYVSAEALAEAERVWQINEQGDAIEAGRQSDAIVRVAELLRENNRLPEAREQYRRAASLRPWDFGMKLRQAELLSQLGAEAEARAVAAPVARFVETDRELAACARHTTVTLPEPLPDLDTLAPAEGEVVLGLVAAPDTDRWLLNAVGREVAAVLGVRAGVVPKAFAPGPWDRTGRHQLATELRRTIPWEDPRMGLVRMNGEKFRPETLTSDQVIELMRTLLTREANAKGVEALAARVAEADKIRQWDAGILLQRLRTEYPQAGVGKVVYVALVPVDLYLGRANFVFGSAASEGGYAVVSFLRFSAAATGEPPQRERLAARTAKQLLSSVGFALGVARCANPICARCLPRSLPEQDAKGAGLCATCREGLAKALGHSVDGR